MRGAGVGGLLAHGFQPLLIGLVHALGDGDEEIRIRRALALGARPRQLDRAPQRRPGGEAAPPTLMVALPCWNANGSTIRAS